MVPYLEKTRSLLVEWVLQLVSYYKVMEGYQNFQT